MVDYFFFILISMSKITLRQSKLIQNIFALNLSLHLELIYIFLYLQVIQRTAQ